jgi:hypothetical protein
MSMMSKKCHEFDINTLLTAHHLDDMLETYLMRKSKKSSILGLSYSNSFFYNNIQVIRPLSSFLKSELIDYLNITSLLRGYCIIIQVAVMRTARSVHQKSWKNFRKFNCGRVVALLAMRWSDMDGRRVRYEKYSYGNSAVT